MVLYDAARITEPGMLCCFACYMLCLQALFAANTQPCCTHLQVDVDKVHGFEQYRGKCQPVFLLYKVS